MSARRAVGLAAGLIVLVPVLLIGRGLLPDYVLSSAGLEERLPWVSSSTPTELALPQMNMDLVREKLSYTPFLHDTMRSGQMPWWLPDMLAGVPFVAFSRTAVLYPPTWLSVWIPGFGHGPSIALHLVIAGLGAFAWLGACGRSPLARCVGAIVFMLNGMFVTRHGHPQFAATGCWLPWVLLGIEWLFANRRAAGMLLVAGATALAVLAGHPSIYIYGYCFIGAYLLIRLAADSGPRWSERGGLALAFGAAFAIGVGLASLQLLATLELREHSLRGVRQVEDLVQTLPHWTQALRLLFPNVLGTPLDGSYWSVSHTSFAAGSFYVGVAPLLLAAAGIVCGEREGRWLGGIAAAVLLILFVPPIYRLAYALPGFDFSRVDRLAIALFLALTWLAARGVDGVFANGRDGQRLLGWRFPAAFTAVGVTAAALALFALPSLAGTHGPDGGIDRGALLQRVVWGAFLLVASLLWLVAAARGMPAKGLAIGILALTATDLIVHARPFVVTRHADRMFRDTPAIRYLRDAPGPFRIAKFDPEAGPNRPGGRYRILPANTPTALGIEDLHGYSPLRPHDIDLLLEAVEPGISNTYRVKPFQKRSSLDSPVLDLLQARYVLSSVPVEGEHLRLVHDGDLRIYENENAMPRVTFVPRWERLASQRDAARRLASGAIEPRETVLLEVDPDLGTLHGVGGLGQVDVVARDASSLVVRKHGPGAGIVRVAEAFYPGWSAKIDGRDVPVLRADVMLRAVAVGPGEHTIEMRYRPTYLRSAILITAVSALGFAGTVIVAWRRTTMATPPLT